jgi:phosphoglucosamine mutase
MESGEMKFFGSSGIRDVVNKELVLLALEIGLSVGRSYRSTVVGRDTRTSSDALKHALISGLLAAGSRAYDAGIIPTPTLAYAARTFESGAMVTASHNPPQYNGIKLCNPDGSAFDSRQRKEIEADLANRTSRLAPWDRMQAYSIYAGAIEEHIEYVLENSSMLSKLKVVLDCGCGAASLVTPHVLRKLGCELVTLNCYPSGYFPRPIEPTPDNLETLITAVRDTGADLGIAHDGDGDRMVAVDDKGRFVPGDKLLAVFALSLKAKRVVTTVDASMALEDLGFQVIRTKVGDAFVSEVLTKGGDFGGEPSGAWIFPQISYCPDGIYAAAHIAQIASENKISKLVDDIPSYSVLRGSVRGDGAVMAKLEQRLMSMEADSVNTIDGIRLAFGDGWLLIRASGTEPKIRVTAEARTEERAQGLYDSGVEAVRRCLEVERE